LIYYCVKTQKQFSGVNDEAPKSEATEEAQQKIQDFIAKGKVQELERPET